MNKQQKYNKIREKMIEILPDIVELKYNCRLKKGDREYLIIDVFTNVANEDWNYIVREDLNHQPHREVRYLEMDFYKIIGRDITLADVLLFLDKFYNKGYITNIESEILEIWNLPKNLQDQDEKTFDFIIKILGI